MELSTVFERFESLGNNCEFGIVQAAAAAAVPIGLFRNVGFLHTEQIVGAIEAGLEGMFDPGNFDVDHHAEWPDYALQCRRYGFIFHTGIPRTEGNRKRIDRQVEVFRYLKAQFLDLLREGRRIFVYRHLYDTHPDLMLRLLAALRRHGPGRLLHVTQTHDRKFAWLERLSDHHFAAGITHLSNENPPVIDYSAWAAICRGVLTMLDATAETAIAVPAPPAALPDAAVIAHTPGEVTREFRLALPADPGRRYTARAWVWLPSGFQAGGPVGLRMQGYPTEVAATADPARTEMWQPVLVSTRVPEGQTLLVPTLDLSPDARGTLFSCGWSVAPEPRPERPTPALTVRSSLDYLYNNGGLNNQKLALLGLFDAARRRRLPVRLPDLYLYDQAICALDAGEMKGTLAPRRDERRIRFDRVFDPAPLRDFARAQGIDLIDGPPTGEPGGWEHFQGGGAALAAPGRFGDAFTRGFFAALTPRMRRMEALRVVQNAVLRIGIGTVLHCRVERDSLRRQGLLQEGQSEAAQQLAIFDAVLGRLVRSLPADSLRRGIYVANDESGLAAGKEAIRHAVGVKYGIALYWKSDFGRELFVRMPALQASVLDFEIAVGAETFIGSPRSSFADLVAYERFVRTGEAVTDHWVYDAPGALLERRRDNGIHADPVRACAPGRPLHEPTEA